MTKKNKDLDLVIYNDAQRFYVNVVDNCTATIQQFKDSLKLQKDIKEMAEQKVKDLRNI